MNITILKKLLLISFFLLIKTVCGQNLIFLWDKTKKENLLPMQTLNTASQHRILANSARQHPTFTAYFNHEAFKFNDFNQGMYSFYVQQSFNLPQVAQSYRQWQENLAKNSDLEALIVQNGLKIQLYTAYADITDCKMWVLLLQKRKSIYQQWENIAQSQYNAGISNKIPLLQAKLQQEQLNLSINQKKQLADIHNINLEYISNSKNISVVDSFLLDMVVYLDSSYLQTINEQTLQNHLYIKQAFQFIAANDSKQKNVESQLLPQVYTQVQLQVLDKQAMYYGFGFGVTAPIFTQNIKAQSEQIKQQSKGLKLNLDWNLQTLQAHLTTTAQQIERLETALRQYKQEILPLAEQQLAISLKTYQNGDTDYLYFLQSTQQLFQQQDSYYLLQREYIQQRILWDYYLALP